jgi:hypothetical protein
MANYYSILARAVSRLATNNAQTRQELYEHARAILIAQSRGKDPQISALGTMGEQVAFEAAILRVEAESRSERSSETFADHVPLSDANDMLDFASLLREPVLPTPSSNNIRLGVSPPPSRLIPKKFTKKKNSEWCGHVSSW